MALSTKTKTTRTVSAVTPTVPAAHRHTDLEAKVSALESKLTVLEAELRKCLASISSQPAPSGRDDDLRAQLKQYFATVDNTKRVTQLPNL